MKFDCNTTMDALAALVGFKEAMLLIAAHGGEKIMVPETMTDTHRIAELIGIDGARWLSQHYPSAELQLPLLSEYDAVRRIAQVHDLSHREGLRVGVIAKILGVSPRTIEQDLMQANKYKPTRRFASGSRERDRKPTKIQNEQGPCHLPPPHGCANPRKGAGGE